MNTRVWHLLLSLGSAVCRTGFTIAVFGLATGAVGHEGPLNEELTRLEEQSKKIKDLTAHFVEKKFTAMLKEPLVSKGRVFVRSARTRWETTEPQRSTLYTDDKQVVLYFPSRTTAEVYPIDRRLRPLVVSPVPRLTTLRRYFRMELTTDVPTTELLVLNLTPKDDALAEFIDEVRVEVDPSRGVVRRFEMIDPDGDRTVIEFAHIRTNVGLAEKDVAWSFPPDTTIVHPLDTHEARTATE